MNKLEDIGIILAHTARSRAYLSALIRNKIQPSFAFILGNQEITNQEDVSSQISGLVDKKISQPTVSDCWSELEFCETDSVVNQVQELGCEFEVLEIFDINDDQVIRYLQQRNEKVFIYSGYSGVILKNKVLQVGKTFLHVHGGYLPDFKGSTTNYYSILTNEFMGASAIFLNEQIDSGPILYKAKFPVPKDKIKIDTIYDSAARAKVLVDTLKIYLEKGAWELQVGGNNLGETFYIIHPVLKHIAIMAK